MRSKWKNSRQVFTSVSSQLAVENQTSKTFNQLDELGKRKLFGKVELAEKDYKGVIALAKEGILSRRKINDLTRQLVRSNRPGYLIWQRSWDRLYEQTKEFRQAVKLAPQRVKQLFADIFSRAREEREARRNLHIIMVRSANDDTWQFNMEGQAICGI